MILAPHPDDDTLAAAGLMQSVIDRGGSVRVVYLTSGGNNPWAQRVIERRWRIGPSDQIRWAVRRRGEALESLRRLGADPASTAFLEQPDYRLSDVLLQTPDALVTPLEVELRRWKPTLLLAPSLRDRHPDHGVTGIAVRAAVARLPRSDMPFVLAYEIHGSEARNTCAWANPLDECQLQTKRDALLAHVSQLAWHRRSFLSRAWACERFMDERYLAESDKSDPPGCTLERTAGGWTFEFKTHVLDRLDRIVLFAVAHVSGRVLAVRVPLATRRKREWATTALQPAGGVLRWDRAADRYRAVFTGRPMTSHAEWFVKIEHPWGQSLGLMDRWPWLGVASPQVTRGRRFAPASDGEVMMESFPEREVMPAIPSGTEARRPYESFGTHP